MNRDNVLFVLIGILAGFIGGYVMHEAMAARQPPPRVAGAPPAAEPGRASPAAPSTGAAPGAGQPAMEEVQRLSARVAENPDDAEATRRLANLNYDISNWERAAELYSRFLELEPGNPDVMTDLGATYRYLGRPREALEQFHDVKRNAPDHWQARYNEVLVLAFDLDDLQAANAAMAELMQLQPDNPDVSRLAVELEKRSKGA